MAVGGGGGGFGTRFGTVGGGGVSPLDPRTPPTKVTIAGNHDFTMGKSGRSIFGAHTCGSQTPSPTPPPTALATSFNRPSNRRWGHQ